MARATTTSDAFNAVAEPRRRQILDALASGERSVGELVEALQVAQPVVSKHLKVLRDVDLVAMRESGRRRLYRLNGAPLRRFTTGCGATSNHGRRPSTGWTLCWESCRSQEDQ